MGNCSIKGLVDAEEQHCTTKTNIRVLSDSGRILQFQVAIMVKEILTDFPGYGLFRQLGHLSSPLSGSESLVSGQLYYLLPLLEHGKCSTCFSVRETEQAQATETEQVEKQKESQIVKDQKCSAVETEQVEKKKNSQIVKSATETEQEKEDQKCCAMETEQVEAKTEEAVVVKKKRNEMEPARMSSVDQLTNGSALEVLPSKGNGVWRVKLVINTKQLEEIFSEDVNTEALIEKMRNAASSSSESVTPRTRKAKSGWGGVTWKPTPYNVFKIKNDSSVNSK